MINPVVCYALGVFAVIAALIYTFVETDCDRKPARHPWEDAEL